MDVRSATMHDRIASQLLMEKVVENSDARPPLTTFSKIFGFSPIHRDDRSWHTGAIGERVVANTLSRLPVGWHVFHSIPVGTKDADVDHIVVGPGGIFTINTKHHPGKNIWVRDRALWVSGQSTHYISNAESEAKSLTRLLRTRLSWVPDVRPVVVIVNAREIEERKAPKVVHVDGGRTVGRWLRRRRAQLSPDAVAQIAVVIDDPRMWRTTLSVDRTNLLRRYYDLVQRDRQAVLVRAGWCIAFAIVVAIVVFSIVTATAH
jgi:Nuclease-related domain